jgi:FtsH-binding integral membrane protein
MMNYVSNNVKPTTVNEQIVYDEGLRKFMLGVYNSMTISLAISGFVALFVSMSPGLMSAIWGSPLKWVVIFSPLVMSLGFAFLVDKISSSTARKFLFVFAAAMGLSLTSIFAVFTISSIVQVFFITAATFGAASLYGYTTKRDMTNIGSFLMMGVIGIVIALIVNIFLQSSLFGFIVSCLAVLIFTGLTAYDTQNLKNIYDSQYDEEMEKSGVIGALGLYMNFINIFVHLLQIIGDKKE